MRSHLFHFVLSLSILLMVLKRAVLVCIRNAVPSTYAAAHADTGTYNSSWFRYRVAYTRARPPSTICTAPFRETVHFVLGSNAVRLASKQDHASSARGGSSRCRRSKLSRSFFAPLCLEENQKHFLRSDPARSFVDTHSYACEVEGEKMCQTTLLLERQLRPACGVRILNAG